MEKIIHIKRNLVELYPGWEMFVAKKFPVTYRNYSNNISQTDDISEYESKIFNLDLKSEDDFLKSMTDYGN